ncbi:MAG: hypothetical protein GWP03_03490 [Proteobacteria bacterium]|nr:hypothetical protein [Pseudomonadota bacterium]
MKIKVYGILKRYVGDRDYIKIDIPEPTTVADLFSKAGIPGKYVFIVEKNGKAITKDITVNNDDEISLIPFISGG